MKDDGDNGHPCPPNHSTPLPKAPYRRNLGRLEEFFYFDHRQEKVKNLKEKFEKYLSDRQISRYVGGPGSDLSGL